MGYTGAFWGHKSRALQAAAGFRQGEVTQGSVGLCCSPSRVWLCCIVLGSLPAHSRARSSLTPAGQKSAQSVPGDASGVPVQHTNHFCFPTAHSSAQYWWGVGAGLFWGNGTLGNAGGRGKDQPGVASLGCSCCPHTPAPELERARDLKRNFSASWWISDWPFLLLVYEKKIKGTYLSSAGCP